MKFQLSKSPHFLPTSTAIFGQIFNNIFHRGCNEGGKVYVDFASLANAACIPIGTTRTTLVTVYINFLPQSEVYETDGPALQAALEILGKAYPCS